MSNKEQYAKICEKHPELPVFVQPWWLDAVCKHWDVAISRKGDMVTGIWAYPIEKKIGVSLLRTPKLTPYLGPQVFFPSDLKESNLDSFEHEVVSDLIKQLPKASVWHLAMQPGMKQAGIFKSQNLQTTVQQTFLLELYEDEETLLGNMKDAMRRNVRIAEDEFLLTNSPENLKELFRFHKQTLSKKGKSVPYSYKELQRVLKILIAHNSCAVWVARNKSNKTIQAVVWQVWDKKCSYYFMGGQNPDTNSSRAMSLLLWHSIKEAKRMGNTVFDLEGSMDEGVEKFFRSFGGDRALYMIAFKNKSLIWKLKQMIFK